ncbi:HEAT repeat domain-containing protein [Halomarina oriensis]|uniref:HEAT repeat domain-containing protein n=1 Tax=Halomarina oriensis TaxID=671145 RepID=UPI001E48E461|nr:HEAT repeat domain-containing protein [Halomarina oriensis]
MTTDSRTPLDDVDPETVSPGDVDASAVRAALDASGPLTRQRGVEVCRALAEQDVDAVRPFLDAVAALTAADNAAISMRAIGVLDTVASTDPDALDGRLAALAATMGTDITDVQLTGATLLGKVVVERPALVAPHVEALAAGVGATELDPDVEDFAMVDDEVTRRTLQEHEESERRRVVSARRTLVDVVVAVCETEPRAATDAVDTIVDLLDDVDPGVAGGAVDALGHLAAADPTAVAPVTDRLVDCLDHDRTVVRARAVRALGRLGDPAVVPDLRRVAASDADETVREVAEQTATYLDEE